jgi:hypothetical protein
VRLWHAADEDTVGYLDGAVLLVRTPDHVLVPGRLPDLVPPPGHDDGTVVDKDDKGISGMNHTRVASTGGGKERIGSPLVGTVERGRLGRYVPQGEPITDDLAEVVGALTAVQAVHDDHLQLVVRVELTGQTVGQPVEGGIAAMRGIHEADRGVHKPFSFPTLQP